MGGGFIIGGDAALLDAGSRENPFIGRIDEFGKVVIGENFFRKITPGPCDRYAVTHGRSEGEEGPGRKLRKSAWFTFLKFVATPQMPTIIAHDYRMSCVGLPGTGVDEVDS